MPRCSEDCATGHRISRLQNILKDSVAATASYTGVRIGTSDLAAPADRRSNVSSGKRKKDKLRT
ncbi:hypothetical protein E2C01_028001 [Portunus trituberculatus]|uniref:Uncharacterized protein n=1 Tax=Portunus trituberculatus TaxID=210409 RepID=A0A5B7EN23_PORTR|nr:hypothetical protein [Portunus trituberculatus]